MLNHILYQEGQSSGKLHFIYWIKDDDEKVSNHSITLYVLLPLMTDYIDSRDHNQLNKCGNYMYSVTLSKGFFHVETADIITTSTRCIVYYLFDNDTKCMLGGAENAVDLRPINFNSPLPPSASAFKVLNYNIDIENKMSTSIVQLNPPSFECLVIINKDFLRQHDDRLLIEYAPLRVHYTLDDWKSELDIYIQQTIPLSSTLTFFKYKGLWIHEDTEAPKNIEYALCLKCFNITDKCIQDFWDNNNTKNYSGILQSDDNNEEVIVKEEVTNLFNDADDVVRNFLNALLKEEKEDKKKKVSTKEVLNHMKKLFI